MELKTMRKTVLLVWGSMLALGIPYLVWCLATGQRLKCFLYESTGGIKCPACGASRMFVHMAKGIFSFITGDFSDALMYIKKAYYYNSFFMIAFFVCTIISVLMYCGKPSFLRKNSVVVFLSSGFILVFVLFGVLRNIC